MRRPFALVVAAALVSSSASATPLHVHDYRDHDHPEHHHGIAAHDHADVAPPDVDHHGVQGQHHRNVESVSCNAGRHAVSITTAYASVAQVHIGSAELPGPAFAVRPIPVRSALRITDVRVHGPPFLQRLSARAPPISLPA